MNKNHIVLVRSEYTRDLQIYNLDNGEVNSFESGWEDAVLPGYLGIYPGTAQEAMLAAAGDHGIVPAAMFTIEL